MTIKERVQADMKAAMKGGRQDELRTLRMLLSVLKNKEIDLRHPLSDAEAVQVVQTAIKQRNESATQFTAAGRQELADQELGEARILEGYLPAQLSDAELDTVIDAVVRETGATGAKDLGAVMKQVMPRCAGKADGARVSARVRSRLTA